MGTVYNLSLISQYIVLNKLLLQLDRSLPANPVNDQRIANAVTLKNTFCLPQNQQLFKNI